MYGYPKSNTKILNCNLINNLAQISYISQWILFGDLNLITTVNKKKGNPSSINIIIYINKVFFDCALQDLVFFRYGNLEQ